MRSTLITRICFVSGILWAYGLSATVVWARTHWPLQINDNGRYFTESNGEAYLPIIDTVWMLSYLQHEDVTYYLERRTAKGFNAVLVSLIGPERLPRGLNSANAYGHQPFAGTVHEPDTTKPNPAFFSDFKVTMKKCLDHDVAVFLILGWAACYQDAFTRDSYRAYCEFVLNQYPVAEFPHVVFCLGGDKGMYMQKNLDKHMQIRAGRHLAKLMRSRGDRRLISEHPGRGSSVINYRTDEESGWLDIRMVQSGHRRPTPDVVTWVKGCYERTPTKPFFNGEPLYESHNPGLELEDVRWAHWVSVFGGACAVGYGCHGFWGIGVDLDGRQWGRPGHDRDWWKRHMDDQPVGEQMRYFATLNEQYPFHKAEPDYACGGPLMLERGGIKDRGAGGLVADYKPALLARDQTWGLVYLPHRTVGVQKVTIKMDRFKAPVKVRWFDPTSGEFTGAQSADNRGTKAFTAPGRNRGGQMDWVLVLGAAKAHEARSIVVPKKGVAPPEDRVQVYVKNPCYLQYRSKPVFPIGCNQGWTRSLQDLDHNYQAEFAALHRVGGNLVRVTPFIGLRENDEDLFSDRHNSLPWKRQDKKYLLDLETHGGNPLFWERLSELVAYAHERDILISFEFWDLYSAARGPGGNLRYSTPPGNRWSAHPFAPGNNKELVGEHALPAKTHMKDIAFCRPVTQGGYDLALKFQEQYIARLLDVLSPYPNVIYCMVNETSAEKTWSDHWLRFTHDYFQTRWHGAPYLAGEMPREYSFVENFTVEDMLDDSIYGFADMSQYGRGSGLREMRAIKENMVRFRAYRFQNTARLKPLTCMKIYNTSGPAVLWMRLFAGCATARYHRALHHALPVSPKEAPAAQRQLDYVGVMARFLEGTDFKPWLMLPNDAWIVSHPSFDEVLAMRSEDRGIYAALFLCQKKKDQHRPLHVKLPTGKFDGFWLNPASGHRKAVAISSSEGAGSAQITLNPPTGPGEVVLFLKSLTPKQ